MRIDGKKLLSFLKHQNSNVSNQFLRKMDDTPLARNIDLAYEKSVDNIKQGLNRTL